MEWDDFRVLNGMGNGTKEEYLSNYKELPMVPYGKVDSYREKFIWKPGIVSKNTIEIGLYDLSMYNGEKDRIYYESNLGENLFYQRAVPKEIDFNWQANNKSSYLIRIKFKENDIYKAFQTVCIDKNTKARLILKINNEGEMEKIVLSNGNYEYVLNPEYIRVYPSNGNDYDNKIRSLKKEE